MVHQNRPIFPSWGNPFSPLRYLLLNLQNNTCHCLFKMHIDTKLTYKHISDNDSIFRYCHV